MGDINTGNCFGMHTKTVVRNNSGELQAFYEFFGNFLFLLNSLENVGHLQEQFPSQVFSFF